MELDYKVILGAGAVVLGLAGYVPYFIGIFKGRTKPHVFSWFIWGLLTAIAFAIQLTEKAGPGAWITGVTAVVCFVITALALQRGERTITPSDKITFIAALASIPLWLATKNPFYSVLLITVIDALGFYPTFRKTWHKPWEEALVAHFMSGLKWVLAIAALDQVNFNTAFYPLSLVFMNNAFVFMALWRRHKLKIAA